MTGNVVRMTDSEGIMAGSATAGGLFAGRDFYRHCGLYTNGYHLYNCCTCASGNALI